MKTLYIRNVPDDVAERIGRLAHTEGMSVNAFTVRELGRIARRADNAALLHGLPSANIAREDILDAIHADRRDR